MKKRTRLKTAYILLFLFSLIGFLLFIIADVMVLNQIFNEIQKLLIMKLSFNNITFPFEVVISAIFKILSFFLSIFCTYIFANIAGSIFSYFSYQVAAGNFMVKKYNLIDAVMKNFEWNFFRLGISIIPCAGMVFFIILISLAFYLFFNTILFFASISIPILSFVIVFSLLCTVVWAIFALPACFWNNFISFFGSEVAISEPKMNNTKILRRSENIISEKSFNSVLYCLCNIYALFFIIYLVQSALNNIKPLDLVPFIIINILIMGMLNYLKVFNYIASGYSRIRRVTFESIQN